MDGPVAATFDGNEMPADSVALSRNTVMLAMSASIRRYGAGDLDVAIADALREKFAGGVAASTAAALLGDAINGLTSHMCACSWLNVTSVDVVPATMPALLIPTGPTTGSVDASIIKSPDPVHTAPRAVFKSVLAPRV